MNLAIEEFVRSSVRIAVDKVLESEARFVKLSVHNPGKLFWITIEFAPQGHGCGLEEPGLVWIHSHDRDRFAGSRDYSVNQKISSDRTEITETLFEFFESRLESDLVVESEILSHGHDGQIEKNRGSSITGIIEKYTADSIP